MGRSDKTDKPAEEQSAVEAPKVDEIHDAVIVEDSDHKDFGGDDGVSAPVEMNEPESDSDAQESDSEAESDAQSVESGGEVAEEISEPEPEPEPEPVARTGDAPRKNGVLPLVFGGVISGAIGFGAAFYLGGQMGRGAETEAALATLRQQIAEQTALAASLQSKQSEIAQTASRAQEGLAEIGPLADGLAAQAQRIEALDNRVAAFESRLTDIEKRPLNEGLSAAAIAAYEREVEDLKDLVAAQKAEAADLRDTAQISAQAALARSAVTRIVAALDNGAPYRGAIVDYGSATGKPVPGVLEENADGGVATLPALLDAYPGYARAALALARDEKVDSQEGSKLGSFLKTQLGARSVEPKAGGDTDAILSRVEAALRAGRLADGLAELDTLAEGPKSVMSDWRMLADTRLAAMQAAEELAQSLNTN